MDGPVALCCRHVVEARAPILEAERAAGDGAEWRFRCGDSDDAAPLRPAALEAVLRRDPTAVEIVLHPRGTRLARRAAGARWYTDAGPVLFPHRPSRRWPGLDPRFAPRPNEPLEPGDLRLLADVADRGWHTALSAPGASTPHAFSIGLFRSFDHPEVAVLGLLAGDGAAVVDRIAARVRDGERFGPEDVVDGLIEGRTVAFRGIPPRRFPSWLGHAVWYHDGARFPALQAIWSDATGRFPWDPWFPRGAREAQPVLYEAEPA
jgi:hypothetical protein